MESRPDGDPLQHETMSARELGERMAFGGGPPANANFEPLSTQIIGVAIHVQRLLGPGFREELYENALCIELRRRDIEFQRQVLIPVHFEGEHIGDHSLDLVIGGTLVVELKAVSALLEIHAAQLVAYLRAARQPLGLLLNFGEVPLGIRRVKNPVDR